MSKKEQKSRLVYFGLKYYPSRGGVSRTTEHLIRQLKDKYDITIYCYKNPEAKDYLPGVRAIQLPRFGKGSIGVFPYFFLCTLHMLFFGKYDIVHLRKIDSSFFLPLIRLKFKKVLATSHERTYLSTKWSAPARTFFQLNERIFMKSPATLNAISKSLCAYYEQKYKREVIYTPNGVNQLSEYNEKGADELLRKYGTAEGYLFFAARRIMATKGLHLLLDAMHALDFKGEVLVAGETNHDREYMKAIESHPAYSRLKWIGYISDNALLLALVRRSKLFLFPSLSEGMSIMLLETAGTGTPVLCSDIVANTDILDDTEVLFFKSGDPLDLEKKLSWALDNPDALSKMAERAQVRAKTEYSGDNMTRQYEALYDQILGS
jgi:glycosyltransferase involved in cell wall biosynthesis